jgi:hypothetical protein
MMSRGNLTVAAVHITGRMLVDGEFYTPSEAPPKNSRKTENKQSTNQGTGQRKKFSLARQGVRRPQ